MRRPFAVSLVSLALACGSAQSDSAALAADEPLIADEPPGRASAGDCGGEELLFRCETTEGATAQICLHGAERLTASFGTPEDSFESWSAPLAETGWCTFTSPHMSHVGAYVGAPERRFIVRSIFVNPEAEEFHGSEPESMPDEPTWEVIRIEGQQRQRAECEEVETHALDGLDREGVTISHQEGCESFGER